jgi:hypothetical protein
VKTTSSTLFTGSLLASKSLPWCVIVSGTSALASPARKRAPSAIADAEIKRRSVRIFISRFPSLR